MNIRRLICALLAMLLMAMPAMSEGDDDLDFGFDDGGYTGEWLELGALGIDLCLPEGWNMVEPGEGEGFAAMNAEGTASMAIRVEAEGVEDFDDWAEANLTNFKAASDDYDDILYVESGDAVTVYRIYEERLLAFSFNRANEEALPVSFALDIVYSAEETWLDEFGLYDDEEEYDPFAG